MTDAELYELVKDIPEAWPAGLYWAVEHEMFTNHDSDDADVIWFIRTAHAILMFEASVARMLDKTTNHWGTITSNTDIRVVSLCMGHNHKTLGAGPTRLHALIAAYRATKESRP